ncbi:hypothetical protein EGR_08055 [Echinococcus granulosus]|uniref:Uncharacterized protein n=1 Tax=Echinococcus granulosus TaxID=6210 RepID=W6UG47_ECHGR|nr:hypothetical protein EGR_08055 [Echinococcus granulosus]EUB57107.1 hypothetical protein EGR_08055 [Echinococcus granulosus]
MTEKGETGVVKVVETQHAGITVDALIASLKCCRRLLQCNHQSVSCLLTREST